MKAIFYDWGGLNVWLFHLVNNIHSELLDRFMLLGTGLGGHDNFGLYLALACLLAAAAVGRGDRWDGKTAKRWLAVVAVFGIAAYLDGALLNWLKPLLDFPRPPLALAGNLVVVGTPELHHSLPSGHSSFAMLVAASLWPALGPKWRSLAATFVVWVGLSRISLGAHFPADVLAGMLSALLIVVLVRALVAGLLHLEPAR